MTKKYVIRNSGEANACIIRELTNEQATLIQSIVKDLNKSGEAYAPYLSIWEATEEDLEYYNF